MMLVGLALTVEVPAFGPAAVTVSEGFCVSVIPPATAVTVLEPALVAATLPEATPLPSVVAAGWVTTSPTTDDDSVTEMPLRGFPRPSFTVTVMAELPPAVKLGVPTTTVESVAEGAGAVMLKAAEVALVRPDELATSVYP